MRQFNILSSKMTLLAVDTRECEFRKPLLSLIGRVLAIGYCFMDCIAATSDVSHIIIAIVKR